MRHKLLIEQARQQLTEALMAWAGRLRPSAERDLKESLSDPNLRESYERFKREFPQLDHCTLMGMLVTMRNDLRTLLGVRVAGDTGP